MVLIGYKKCQPIKNYSVRLIGIFEIQDDSKIAPPIINEFSKMRISKCKLIGVEDLSGNLLDVQEVEGVSFLETDPHIIFKKNEISETSIFDETNDYTGHGIVMFSNKQRARNYLLDYLEEGFLEIWRDTGILYAEENYKNYKLHGFCKYYHSNGNIKELVEYNYGYPINIRKIFDINGILIKTIDKTIKPIFSVYKT